MNESENCCHHASDCAVHRGPALAVGPCTCRLGGVCPAAEQPACVHAFTVGWRERRSGDPWADPEQWWECLRCGLSGWGFPPPAPPPDKRNLLVYGDAIAELASLLNVAIAGLPPADGCARVIEAVKAKLSGTIVSAACGGRYKDLGHSDCSGRWEDGGDDSGEEEG